MPIPNGIPLSVGQILMCEFGPDPRKIQPPGIMKGPLSVLPEMYKERHCIVINPSRGVTTIVPLSTVPPIVQANFHHCIQAGSYGSIDPNDDSWVKGDMLTTVSNQRLDRPFVSGRRTTEILNATDLRSVLEAVLHGLALGRLTPHL